MVTRPVSTRFQEIGQPVPRSPLSVVVIAPAGTGATVTSGVVTEINATNVDDLGTDGTLKQAYDLLTKHENPFFYALPYETSNDAATQATNVSNAITALGSDAERVKFTHTFNRPRFAILPEVAIGATDANDQVTALKALAASDSLRIGAVFTDGRSASQADAVAWLGNNAGDGLISAMNNGGAIPGSIVAASQWIRYVQATRLDINPLGIDFPLDTPAPSPEWAFLPDSETAAANVLRRQNGTVIITYNGSHYLWGGKINTAVANSPFESVGARLVTFEMADRMEAELLRYNHTRLDTAERTRLATALSAIAEEYVELGECADARIGTPTLASGLLSVGLQVFFFDIVDAAQLTVQVQHVEE